MYIDKIKLFLLLISFCFILMFYESLALSYKQFIFIKEPYPPYSQMHLSLLFAVLISKGLILTNFPAQLQLHCSPQDKVPLLWGGPQWLPTITRCYAYPVDTAAQVLESCKGLRPKLDDIGNIVQYLNPLCGPSLLFALL